jgi:uncharacterized protein (DUF302 family)
MFYYTKEIAKTPDQVIADLTENLKEEHFGVLWHLDIQAKLKEKGVDYDGTYHVLEICNPHEAKRVLSEDLLAGYFMPCKIVVYQDNEKIRIGMPRPTVLVSMIHNENLKSIAEDMEKRLAACIDRSV